MISYRKGYEKTMKAAGLEKHASAQPSMQIQFEASPKTYGIQARRGDENLLPLALSHGLTPALAAGGLSLGGAGTLLTGETPTTHIRNIAKEGLEPTKGRVKTHLHDLIQYDKLKKLDIPDIANNIRNQDYAAAAKPLKDWGAHLGRGMAGKVGRGALMGAAGAGGVKMLSNAVGYGGGYGLAPGAKGGTNE